MDRSSLCRSLVTTVLLATALAGCGGVSYVPEVAESGPHLTERALRFYPADVQAMRAAGAVKIGEIEADSGKPITDCDERMVSHALDQAADHGGTHLILTDEAVDQFFLASTEPSAPAAPPHPHIVVVRVPIDNWRLLPLALRPRPLGV